MDRRRFVPTSDALETRALLSTSQNSLSSLFGFQLTANLNIPITYQQKELRAERLPYYLEKIRPGRYLPPAEMSAIQGDLVQLISRLRKPATAALDQYNYGLRPIANKVSLTAGDINALNHNFGSVLTAASASPSAISSLQSSVYKLASQVNTASPLPAYLATNDYSLILQTALAIGRPMPPPVLPTIAKNQGVQANTNHIKTPLTHPTLVGTYHFHTHVEIVTPGGEVVGVASCRKNDNYKVRIKTPLSPGVYQFRIRAYDTAGNLGAASPLFEIKVVAPQHHATAK